MKSQMKRYTGQGSGGSQVQQFLSPARWGMSPSQWVRLPGWKLFEHPTLGILWSLHHIHMINY